MTEPNDPWSARPGQGGDHPGAEAYAQGERPTDNVGAAHPKYTADPNLAYGAPPNPTMVYPTYENLRDQQIRAQQAPPIDYRQVPPEPPRRSPVMIVGVCVAVGLLFAALVGVGVMVVGSRGDSSSSASGDTSSVVEPSLQQPPVALPPRTTSRAPLGGADSSSTMGNVVSNDGSTLTVQTLLSGTTVTVHTTASTQVVSVGIRGAQVTDLKVGDMVVVQGQKATDGSITARLIISTSLGSN